MSAHVPQNGATALYIADHNGHLSCAHILREAGAAHEQGLHRSDEEHHYHVRPTSPAAPQLRASFFGHAIEKATG